MWFYHSRVGRPGVGRGPNSTTLHPPCTSLSDVSVDRASRDPPRYLGLVDTGLGSGVYPLRPNGPKTVSLLPLFTFPVVSDYPQEKSEEPVGPDPSTQTDFETTPTFTRLTVTIR